MYAAYVPKKHVPLLRKMMRLTCYFNVEEKSYEASPPVDESNAG